MYHVLETTHQQLIDDTGSNGTGLAPAVIENDGTLTGLDPLSFFLSSGCTHSKDNAPPPRTWTDYVHCFCKLP